MTAQINLVNGPSKFDLMLALFDNKNANRKVTFLTESGNEYEAMISAVEAEGVSGESWNIKGSTTVHVVGASEVRRAHFRFVGHFRTSSPRMGHLKFV